MKWHSTANELAARWKSNLRLQGITRPYSAQDVVKLRGTIHIEHTLARMGGEQFELAMVGGTE